MPGYSISCPGQFGLDPGQPRDGQEKCRVYFRAASNGLMSSPDFSFSGNRITCLPELRNCSMFLSTTPRNWAISVAVSFHSPSAENAIGPTMVLCSLSRKYFAIALCFHGPFRVGLEERLCPLVIHARFREP